MTTHFQVPGNVSSSLLQALTGASASALSGGAVFAWATSHGIRALSQSPDFEEFLANHPFDLIVGTDSITDEKAVKALIELSAQFSKLSVRALLNNDRGLFHPKLAWFETERSIRLIVGSGNLTRGGLLSNWEAFTSSEFELDQRENFFASISDWLESAEPGLVSIDDERVLARVRSNSGDERTIKRIPTARPEPSLAVPDYTGWLVAELNKSRKDRDGRSMFSQASFDQTTFQNFFDYSGGEVDILLYPVEDNGALGPLESRKGRYKAASVNYYLELSAAKGLPYPTSGRPVAVFGRLVGGGYTYKVFRPGETGHTKLASWLQTAAPVAAPARMRRTIVTTEELQAVWPANPLLVAEAPGS